MTSTVKKFVRLNGFVSGAQKKFLRKESKMVGKSESELVRTALFEVYGIK